MLNRNVITPKKDLKLKYLKVKNRFTYYPLYDTKKNSYIKRYRLWCKYRDKCIADGRRYVSCKDYVRILKKIGDRIETTLLENPNGVNFGVFTIRQSFNKKKSLQPFMLLTSASKLSGGLKHKNWGFKTGEKYNKKLSKLLKDNKIKEFDYKMLDFKSLNRSLEKQLDIFNDF